MKFCSYNFVFNQAPNNNDIKRVANIMLNEELNRNDTTRIGNNVLLTAVGAQEFSMAPTVQFRCNFMLAHEQFTRTLEQFTRTRIELIVASVLLPARNSRKIIR